MLALSWKSALLVLMCNPPFCNCAYIYISFWCLEVLVIDVSEEPNLQAALFDQTNQTSALQD